jgi:hypothetical protein
MGMPTMIRRRLISESSDTTAATVDVRAAAAVNMRQPDHQKTAGMSTLFI